MNFVSKTADLETSDWNRKFMPNGQDKDLKMLAFYEKNSITVYISCFSKINLKSSFNNFSNF